ncbi:MAG: hypothetical protein VYC85_06710, partial [Pseudomonadota bacterium]|nr:hypothetical protein [Pseudomonadota bacterium]
MIWPRRVKPTITVLSALWSADTRGLSNTKTPSKKLNPPDSTEFSPRFGIGVDFGTSNSAAAVYDGKRIHLISLEETAVVMPSATYIDRELKITTGQAAIDRYVESNMGRTVELTAEVLGEGRSTTGQIGDKGLPEEAQTELIYGQSFVDGGLQGRLFRGIKRL